MIDSFLYGLLSFVKAFRVSGVQSVLHGNKNQIPQNKTPVQTISEILRLFISRYNGFNLCHFIEKIHEFHCDDFKKIPSYTSIRNYFLQQGVLTVSTRKKAKLHRMRKCYEKEGIMVPIDGSHHHWIIQHQPICLTVAIDDATGKILAARFIRTEITLIRPAIMVEEKEMAIAI